MKMLGSAAKTQEEMNSVRDMGLADVAREVRQKTDPWVNLVVL
jgi:hypothetical protein